MSLFKPTDGLRNTYDKILDSTDEVTVYEIENQNVTATVESIYISCDDTATDLTISFKDADDNVLFQPLVASSITEATQITDYHRTMRYGHKITAEAGAADHLQVSVVVIEGAGVAQTR